MKEAKSSAEQLTGNTCPCSGYKNCKGGNFGKPCSVPHCKEYDQYFTSSWDAARQVLARPRRRP